MNPRLYILFLVDKSMTSIMNMFQELLEALIKCMIVLQELNFDPVKEILKIRSHICILMKKVIILRKMHVKMKSFAPP